MSMEILLVNKSTKKYYTYPLHEHGYWEIIYNLYGEGTAIIDEQEYDFREGTIFYIPPETLHRKTAKKGFIDASIFIKDFSAIDGIEVGYFEDDVNKTFLNLLLLAYDTQLKEIPNAKSIISALGDVLYQLMVSWSASAYKRNDSVEAFQSRLAENISNCDFDINSELRKTGYSSSYFRKLFKSHTGYTPVNYLNHLRIEYAKRQFQLYHDNRTIKEIALQSGYSDPYYFSRLFKKHEGISPQKYVSELGKYDMDALTGIHYSD